MDVSDQATQREELDREISLQQARRAVVRDYPAEICTGCTYATRDCFGKNCEAWSECLMDLQRRERAIK